MIGLLVILELLLCGVEFETPLEPHADIRRMDRRHGMVHDLGIGNGPFTAANAIEEVLHVVE